MDYVKILITRDGKVDRMIEAMVDNPAEYLGTIYDKKAFTKGNLKAYVVASVPLTKDIDVVPVKAKGE